MGAGQRHGVGVWGAAEVKQGSYMQVGAQGAAGVLGADQGFLERSLSAELGMQSRASAGVLG